MEPENVGWIKEQVVNFLCGKAFLWATGIFLFYLFITGVLRRIKSLFLRMFVLLSPLRFRRIFINALSLIFMTASFALFSNAKAQLNGSDGRLEAILGGSFAVGLWSVLMFAFHLFHQAQIDRKEKNIS